MAFIAAKNLTNVFSSSRAHFDLQATKKKTLQGYNDAIGRDEVEYLDGLYWRYRKTLGSTGPQLGLTIFDQQETILNEHLDKMERLSQCVLNELGAGALFNEIDGICKHIRRTVGYILELSSEAIIDPHELSCKYDRRQLAYQVANPDHPCIR